ncbi:hypothetical protein DRP04_12160 [Archaeoglobales archaeon]|nr:MAG: hypothetical protein DRP04_12160 [Archaeoglobales archaeon]
MRGLEVGVSIDDIERQSREAEEFYKKLWSKERKRPAWDYIEKKREKKDLEEEQKEEIEDIIEIVKSIAGKYSDFKWNKWEITSIEKIREIALDFEQKIALMVKKLLLSLVLKKLNYTVNPLKKTKIPEKRVRKVVEIIRDLKKLHELGKKWANILGYPPLWLIALEAEYLRSIGFAKLHRWLTMEVGGLELRVYLSSSKGDYLIKRTIANYPTKLVGKIGEKMVFAKKVTEKNKVPVCHAIREVVVDEEMKRYVKVVLTNKTRTKEYDIQGVITCLGDREAMELPILTVVNYVLSDDGKPVKIVLTMDLAESLESDSL